jgi:uncharacterized protein GlcG (DUF336 family)
MNRYIRRLFLLFFLLCARHGNAATVTLDSNDVARVMSQALTRAYYFLTNGTTTNAVIAVVDREGFVLGVVSLQSAKVTAIDPVTEDLAVVNAISKAGTAAFLSSDQDAFTSRTAGYIVQQHFPPLIRNTAPGPLVGVNFSSLAFSDVNYYKIPQTYDPSAYGGGGTNGTPIATDPLLEPLTGLNGSPGGVPLYKGGQLVGGVGAAVKGKGMIPELSDIQLTTGETYDTDEDVAMAAQNGYQAPPAILATSALIGGIRLPYVNSTTRVPKTATINPAVAVLVTNYELTVSPRVAYPLLKLGGVEGEIRAPIIGDPITGPNRLTARDVTNILASAAKNAATIRAGIRLPIGTSAKVFIAVVNNPAPGDAPKILGTFRILDATMFSWDVAVQKARTALFFSSDKGAFSTRAIGFLAETFYPPGIDGTAPGPLLAVQDVFSLLQQGVTNPLNGIYITGGRIPKAPFITTNLTTAVPLLTTHSIASIPLAAPDPSLPNGITIFPGGFPLYRNGELIGAVGVSGDGVDVDDLISAWGTVNFEAPDSIRSDQIIYRGTRLPYAKFPRNPTL